jgi:hypothetical protein
MQYAATAIIALALVTGVCSAVNDLPTSFRQPARPETPLPSPPIEVSIRVDTSFDPGVGPVPLAFACFWNRSMFTQYSASVWLRVGFETFGLELFTDTFMVEQIPSLLPAGMEDASEAVRVANSSSGHNHDSVRVRWWIRNDAAVDQSDSTSSGLSLVPSWRNDAMRFVAFYPRAFETSLQNRCRILSRVSRFEYNPSVHDVPTYGDGFYLLVGCAGAIVVLGGCVYLCKFSTFASCLRSHVLTVTAKVDGLGSLTEKGEGSSELLLQLPAEQPSSNRLLQERDLSTL